MKFSGFKRLLAIQCLAASASLFAAKPQDKNCASPTAPNPMPAPTTGAYNAPAPVYVKGWHTYADLSFIYWQPQQDNMEYAISSTQAVGVGVMTGTNAAPIANSVVAWNPDYKPGFQLGAGMIYDWDYWDSYVQYTWFHNTNTDSTSAPSGGSIFAIQSYPGQPTTSYGVNKASAKWNLKVDFADWQLGRSCYVGTKCTVRPYFGIRGAWIRQTFKTNYTLVSSNETVAVSQKSTSWGIGPSTGIDGTYLFGYGLRMFGDLMGDVLYSRYNMSYKSSDPLATVGAGDNLSVSEHGLYELRPHTSLDLGFGWSSYFDANRWHLDLFASYGFQVFWSQNMFREYYNIAGSTNLTHGNLYLQGLTLTAKVDF